MIVKMAGWGRQVERTLEKQGRVLGNQRAPGVVLGNQRAPKNGKTMMSKMMRASLKRPSFASQRKTRMPPPRQRGKSTRPPTYLIGLGAPSVCVVGEITRRTSVGHQKRGRCR
jgi:hypothetical protein